MVLTRHASSSSIFHLDDSHTYDPSQNSELAIPSSSFRLKPARNKHFISIISLNYSSSLSSSATLISSIFGFLLHPTLFFFSNIVSFYFDHDSFGPVFTVLLFHYLNWNTIRSLIFFKSLQFSNFFLFFLYY